jgi:DNA mismatch repair protein MutS2
MNEHTLRVLEYEKVREIVSGFAASEPGKQAAAGLLPATDAGTVGTLLGETREFLKIFDRGESPPLDGIRDIASQIAKLTASGLTLSPRELLDTAATLAAGRRVKQFFQRFEGKGPDVPRLSAKAARIKPLRPLEDAITNAVDEKAEVRDSASPALRRIRKQIGRTRDEILDRLSKILKAGESGNIVQEHVVTIRDDRYVLPLKPNFRQSLRGVVHGQSGSRATLFVEPLDVLEQNNRLAELRMEEREEIERILRELTSLLAKHAEAIEETFIALAGLDAICARARFGLEYKGTVPEISSDGGIRLRAARHPLLVWKQKSVPGARGVILNDLDLGGEDRALIISGPNAGGKTVMLKTAGLLCLMAQSGIPVTAAEGSEIPVLRSVYADIGDEQSLEQDLSTFSSHVGRIAEILRHAEKDSLVLLDELGAGTDPAEGAALGAAVLAGLLERGCMVITTTHHSSLKLFGARTSGAVNAAMEFDPETLRPTYRFIPGRPGRSYGLDMAARLGVPEVVVRDAFLRLGEHEAGLDRLLEQMESDSRKLHHVREEAEKGLAAARVQKEEAETLLRAAREEARALKAKIKEEARDVVYSLRQKLKDLSKVPAREAVDATKERAEVESLAKRLEPEEPEQERISLPPGFEFRPGDRVRVQRLKKTAIVLASHKGVLEIETGGKKLKLPAIEVTPVEGRQEPPLPAAPGWSAELLDASGMPDRLNLLGLHVDEALAEVERFIDRAGINNFSSVTIIHGLGTGALKSAVTEFLKKHPLVAAIRPGEPAEGGAGVTVAELKK